MPKYIVHLHNEAANALTDDWFYGPFELEEAQQTMAQGTVEDVAEVFDVLVTGPHTAEEANARFLRDNPRKM